MCRTSTCTVVYFQSGESLGLSDVQAVPFHKGKSPERLVCFCFQHSVVAVEEDVGAGGVSAIEESIRAACRDGLDDCERKNPRGRCCLGNVRAVVRGRVAADGEEPVRGPEEVVATEEEKDCCADSPEEPTAPAADSSTAGTAERGALAATGSALLASVLSSACCWIPLLALGVGASTAGVGAFFEAWRIPLLVVTVSSLAGGFYLAYRRPACEPGDACAQPNPRLRRMNRLTLWISTGLVAAFALFPEYVSAITGGGSMAAAAAASQGQERSQYRLKGMTCLGCEAHARQAIAAIPGVVSVAVSYQHESADVVWQGAADDDAVAEAVGEFGYRASRQ